MTWHSGTISLKDERATIELADLIAPALKLGDTLLLSGAIGAGKSFFSRAIIRHIFGQDTEVPSPTFTLVQTYSNDETEVWHCDLYRLLNPDDIFELGLDEAFETAICLIEWPDRLGQDAPENALNLEFRAETTGHSVQISGPDSWSQLFGARSD